MSGCSTFGPASCAGRRSGCRLQAGESGCAPSGWGRSSSGRGPPSCTGGSRWAPPRGSGSSPGLRPRNRARHGPAAPRVGAALGAALVAELHRHNELRASLVHRARASGLLMAAAMDHLVDGPEGTVTAAESEPDLARLTVSTELEPGQRLRIVKF